jgi:hypothetical protein
MKQLELEPEKSWPAVSLGYLNERYNAGERLRHFRISDR